MNRSLAVLLLTVFLDSVGFGLIIPIMAPLILGEGSSMFSGISLSERGWFFGFIVSAYCIAQFIGSPLLGALSDRYGRKKILQITLIAGVIGYALSLSAMILGSVALFIFSRFLEGVAAGNFTIVQSMMADLSSSEEIRRKNFSLLGMAWGVGFILGPYFGGVLAHTGGILTPFFYACIFCSLNWILGTFLLNETLKVRSEKKWTLLQGIFDLKRVFSHAELRGIFIVAFLFSLGWGFFTEFSPVFLTTRFHFEALDIGNFYAYAGVWVALCQGLFIRPLLARYSPVALMRCGLFFLALNLFVFLAFDASWICYVAVPLIAFPESLIYPNSSAIVSTLSGENEQGEMLGIHNSLQWASMGFIPLFIGSFMARYPLAAILCASGMIFLAFLAFVFYFPRNIELKKQALS